MVNRPDARNAFRNQRFYRVRSRVGKITKNRNEALAWSVLINGFRFASHDCCVPGGLHGYIKEERKKFYTILVT